MTIIETAALIILASMTFALTYIVRVNKELERQNREAIAALEIIKIQIKDQSYYVRKLESRTKTRRKSDAINKQSTPRLTGEEIKKYMG